MKQIMETAEVIKTAESHIEDTEDSVMTVQKAQQILKDLEKQEKMLSDKVTRLNKTLTEARSLPMKVNKGKRGQLIIESPRKISARATIAQQELTTLETRKEKAQLRLERIVQQEATEKQGQKTTDESGKKIQEMREKVLSTETAVEKLQDIVNKAGIILQPAAETLAKLEEKMSPTYGTMPPLPPPPPPSQNAFSHKLTKAKATKQPVVAEQSQRCYAGEEALQASKMYKKLAAKHNHQSPQKTPPSSLSSSDAPIPQLSTPQTVDMEEAQTSSTLTAPPAPAPAPPPPPPPSKIHGGAQNPQSLQQELARKKLKKIQHLSPKKNIVQNKKFGMLDELSGLARFKKLSQPIPSSTTSSTTSTPETIDQTIQQSLGCLRIRKGQLQSLQDTYKKQYSKL